MGFAKVSQNLSADDMHGIRLETIPIFSKREQTVKSLRIWGFEVIAHRTQSQKCDRPVLLARFFGEAFVVELCTNPLLGGAGVGLSVALLTTHPALRAPLRGGDFRVSCFIPGCMGEEAIAVSSVKRQFAIASNPFEQMAAVLYGVISWTDGK
jgi:hypothetical protein